MRHSQPALAVVPVRATELDKHRLCSDPRGVLLRGLKATGPTHEKTTGKPDSLGVGTFLHCRLLLWVRAVREQYLLQCAARGHGAELLPQLLQLLHGDFGGRGRGTEVGGTAACGTGCKLGAFFCILL